MTTATKTHSPVRGPDAYSDEWYLLRSFDPRRKRPVVIGASEAAAACNQSPYSSALQLYMEKRGELASSFTSAQQNRLDMGKRLEPIILDCYEEQAKCHLTRGLPVYFHPQYDFMAATPDAIAYDEDRDSDDFEEWSVDAKSTNWRMIDKTGESEERYGEAGTDQIPLTNLFQAQQQMAVMGLNRCDFPVLVDARELRIYTVQRNDDLIQQIALAEAELSERIRDGKPPEPNWKHEGTAKLLHKLFDQEVGKVAILTETEHDLWTRKEQLSSTEKMIKEELDEIKAQILWALGDAEIGRFPDASIEIKRTVISDTFVKQADVDKLAARVGQVMRAGHSRLTARKIG